MRSIAAVIGAEGSAFGAVLAQMTDAEVFGCRWEVGWVADTLQGCTAKLVDGPHTLWSLCAG